MPELRVILCNLSVRKNPFSLRERYIDLNGIAFIRPYVDGHPTLTNKELEIALGDMEIIDLKNQINCMWRCDSE